MEKYARAHASRKGENMYRETAKRQKDRKTMISYVCMAIIIPILSLILPLSLTGSTAIVPVAWVACMIASALLMLLVKSFGGIAICALAITFFLSYLKDPVPVVVILGTVLISGIYSAATAAAEKKNLALVIGTPLLSAALAFAVTQSIPLTLLSLIYLPPALALGLTARRGLGRARSIAVFTATAAVELLLAVLGYIAWQNGTVNREIIENAVVYLQNSIEWALRFAIERTGAVKLDETLLIEIRALGASAINLMPGLVTVAILTTGFFAHKTQCSLFSHFERDSLLESSETPVTVSCTAAIVFLVAHVFSYTSGASHSPSFVAIAAENLSLILIPALLLIGWEKIAALPKKIGFLAIAVWIGIVLATNALSASIISVLALIGAFCIIFARTDTWAKDHYRKGEDQ